MSLTTVVNSLAQLLNKALPGALPTYLQQLGFGSWMRGAMPTTLRRATLLIGGSATANPYVLGTLDSIYLPDDAKASTVLRATVLAGTNVGTELTFKAPATTTATTGTAGVSPSGDITFLHSDGATVVDVIYVPEKGDMVEYTTLVPASGVVTLPVLANGQVAVTLAEAQITAGSATGNCVILAPSASAPGTTLQANLNALKTQVLFKVSDAPTAVRIKVVLSSAIDQNALLEAAATVI